MDKVLASSEFAAHSTEVKCAVLSPKTKTLLATGGEDCKVNIWNLSNSVNVWSLGNNKSPVERVCFDTDEQNVVSGAVNGSLKVFDLNEGRLARNLGGHQVNVSSIMYHPYGEFIVSGSLDCTMKVWDVRNKTCIQTYTGHDKEITCVRFSPDGKWVASSSSDGQLLIWDLIAGKVLHTLRLQPAFARSFEFHPSEFIIAATTSARTVRLWDLESMAQLCQSSPDTSLVRAMAFVPGKSQMCSATKDGLKVWQWEGGGAGGGAMTLKVKGSVGVPWEGVTDMRIVEETETLVGCSCASAYVSTFHIDLADVVRSTGVRESLGLGGGSEAKRSSAGHGSGSGDMEKDRPPFRVDVGPVDAHRGQSTANARNAALRAGSSAAPAPAFASDSPLYFEPSDDRPGLTPLWTRVAEAKASPPTRVQQRLGAGAPPHTMGSGHRLGAKSVPPGIAAADYADADADADASAFSDAAVGPQSSSSSTPAVHYHNRDGEVKGSSPQARHGGGYMSGQSVSGGLVAPAGSSRSVDCYANHNYGLSDEELFVSKNKNNSDRGGGARERESASEGQESHRPRRQTEAKSPNSPLPIRGGDIRNIRDLGHGHGHGHSHAAYEDDSGAQQRAGSKDMATSMGDSFLRVQLTTPAQELGQGGSEGGSAPRRDRDRDRDREHDRDRGRDRNREGGSAASQPATSTGASDKYTLTTCEGHIDRLLAAAPAFTSMLSTRLSFLRMLRRQWEKGELGDAIDLLCSIHESSRHDPLQLCLLADFLAAVELRGNGLSLDSAVRLLPLLDAMLSAVDDTGKAGGGGGGGGGGGSGVGMGMGSGGEHVAFASLRGLVSLCEAFGDLIRSTRAHYGQPGAAASGVDLSREERLGKCNLCRAILLRIRQQSGGLRNAYRKSRKVCEMLDRFERLVVDV